MPRAASEPYTKPGDLNIKLLESLEAICYIMNRKGETKSGLPQKVIDCYLQTAVTIGSSGGYFFPLKIS